MTAKTKWATVREELFPRVKQLLEKHGYDQFSLSSLSPKTIRTFRGQMQTLFRDWEFNGTKVFVFFNDQYVTLADNKGVTSPTLKVYIMPATKNFKDVYAEVNLEDVEDKSPRYAVPIEDLVLLCEEKVAPVAKHSLKPKFAPIAIPAGEIAFPTEEDVEMSFTKGSEIEDELIKNQSYRDYLAMRYLAPVSTKPWLNKLVKQIHEELYGK